MASSNQQSAYATTCEAANTRTQQKRTTRKNKKVNKKHKKRNLRKTKICVYSADRLTQSISKQNADNLARQVGGARKTSSKQQNKEKIQKLCLHVGVLALTTESCIVLVKIWRNKEVMVLGCTHIVFMYISFVSAHTTPTRNGVMLFASNFLICKQHAQC